MNPIPVNSVNIIQFGFSATFDLENAKLIFNIAGLTLFNPGGQNNTQGINFQVVDPSGAEISRIDFPNMDIDPSTGQTIYEVPLSGSVSQFGYYRIKGVIRDGNGQDYVIELAPKNICKPGADYKNGRVPGVFSHEIDCSVPRLTIMENTNLSYQQQSPIMVTKDGMLYYPQGTLEPVGFTYTPFELFGSGKIYTGDYTVRNKTLATYDMGELVYVIVAYATTYKFSVTCTSNICEVICCLEKLEAVVAADCNSPEGKAARAKIDAATIPLITALMLDKCGQDSGEIVEKISKELGCDCNCDDAELVEPRPIYTTFDPVVLQGQCATTAVLSNGVWLIKTKLVSISNAPGSSTAITFSTNETDCSIDYQIRLNEDLLVRNQFELIRNSPELSSIFNSLVKQNSEDYSAIGANCIYDVTRCDYDLIADAGNAAVQVVNIVIDGTVFAAPAGLSITNALGIQNWLNALSKGTFQVYLDITTNPDTTVIRSLQNTAKIATMTFSLNGVQQVMQFSKNCGSSIDLFRAIILYLCDLTTSQVNLPSSYTICSIGTNGQIVQETITPGPGVTLDTLLISLLGSWCTSLTRLIAATTVNCANVQAVFTNTSAPISSLDVLYGSRGATGVSKGQCGAWAPADLANWLLDYLVSTNDQTVLTKFCQVKDRCAVPVCNPVTYMDGELIEPCPAITGINGVFSLTD